MIIKAFVVADTDITYIHICYSKNVAKKIYPLRNKETVDTLHTV